MRIKRSIAHMNDSKKMRVALLLLVALSSCTGEKPVGDAEAPGAAEPGVVAEVPVLNKQRTPSSARSRQAIARVAPRLVGELDERLLSYGAPVFIRIFKEEKELERAAKSVTV